LALQPSNDQDIVPLSEYEVIEPVRRPRPLRRRLPIWTRLVLLALAGVWLTVFVIAALLDPYYDPAPAVNAGMVALAAPADGQFPWLALAAIANEEAEPTPPQRVPKTMGTHQGPPLNLPPCTFREVTGLPCPSCGMTTSFTMLIHGDVWNSLRANFAGTALCTIGLIYLPWSIVSAWRGRFLFIRSLEMALFRLSIAFMILLFGRWGIALAITYLAQ
jgi:hypothetical protein